MKFSNFICRISCWIISKVFNKSAIQFLVLDGLFAGMAKCFVGEGDLFWMLCRLFQNTYLVCNFFFFSVEGSVSWNKNLRILVIFYFTGWCSIKCCSSRISGGVRCTTGCDSGSCRVWNYGKQMVFWSWAWHIRWVWTEGTESTGDQTRQFQPMVACFQESLWWYVSPYLELVIYALYNFNNMEFICLWFIWRNCVVYYVASSGRTRKKLSVA